MNRPCTRTFTDYVMMIAQRVVSLVPTRFLSTMRSTIQGMTFAGLIVVSPATPGALREPPQHVQPDCPSVRTARPSNGSQLRKHVIRPILLRLGLWSQAAENLLLGTALAESRGMYLKQIRGPALGIYQMEPASHDRLWAGILSRRERLRQRIRLLLVPGFSRLDQLKWNLAYATAMARIYYLAVREPLPRASSAWAMARYWKRYWNTAAGRGTACHFVQNYAAR